ncbi:hypothetical protein DS2_16936 [Catenovulum agarivorans DS-2]|uniref:DUF58 domain-containing protein n=1 Tax=Catenovulum agarivorans DS-2 TaxID=1328313 RepID=W7QK73_9ALTE|nr:hypothetical protein [Catenovulum agarivorans]EWH08513.1 hypothetical protein DS2_16936 [Catenovulum agarivorans DS-2]
MSWFERFRQQQFSRWIAKRVPQQHRHTLNKNNIFILPTGAGIGFLCCWLAVYLLATNYQNNLMLLFSYWLLAIFLLVMLLSFLNLQGLQLSGQPNRQNILTENHIVCLGQSANLKLQLDTDKQRFDLNWHDHAKSYLSEIGRSDKFVQLYWQPKQRGVYYFPRFKLHSTAPMGWFKAWSYLHFPDKVWVCPKPVACPQFLQGTAAQNQSKTNVFSDEFSHLNPYKLGDLPSRIVWKKILPERPIQVKQFSGQQNQQIEYCLQDIPGVLEHKLACITWLVMQAHQNNWLYQVTLPNKTLRANRSEQQYLLILQAIAMVGYNNE